MSSRRKDDKRLLLILLLATAMIAIDAYYQILFRRTIEQLGAVSRREEPRGF